MRVVAAMILALIPAGQHVEPLRPGVMFGSSRQSILSMAGPALTRGAVVTLVTLDDPQEAQRVLVTRPLADSEVMAGHDVPGPYYEIVPESGGNALPGVAIAILGRPDVQRIGTAVALRVGTPPVSARVRSCASSEGLHLTIWDGEPLKGTRLWHEYYYLGYDVEPTCQPGDYRTASGNRLEQHPRPEAQPPRDTRAPGSSFTTYDDFINLSVDQRRTRFRALSAQDKALVVRTHAERWLAANRRRLTASEVGLFQELIDSITPERYAEPGNTALAGREQRLRAKLRCRVNTDDVREAFGVFGSPRNSGTAKPTWTYLTQAKCWLEWLAEDLADYLPPYRR